MPVVEQVLADTWKIDAPAARTIKMGFRKLNSILTNNDGAARA
jgi:hypothetical protein